MSFLFHRNLGGLSSKHPAVRDIVHVLEKQEFKGRPDLDAIAVEIAETLQKHEEKIKKQIENATDRLMWAD